MTIGRLETIVIASGRAEAIKGGLSIAMVEIGL
jgi:hypothetical protein